MAFLKILRDRLEFSKEEIVEFDFFEKEFPKALEITMNSETEIKIVCSDENTPEYTAIIEKLSDYELKHLLHSQDTIFVLDRGHLLPKANRIGRFLISLYDVKSKE